MKQADQERFDALLAWAKSHGASIHSSLEVYKDESTGFSMRVRPDLSPEEIIHPADEILTCPLKTSLSYLNANIGGPLLATPPEDVDSASTFPAGLNGLPPHVTARFFLMKEYLAGESSFWYPYIATLPQPDALASWSLPPFWPEDDAAFLEGTNAGISAQAIRDQLKKEFKEARKALKDADFENWRDYTKTIHDWAFSILSSRSFRPSLVIPQAMRGSVLPKNVSIDDFSILLPVFDIINHSPQAQVLWLIDNESSDANTCRFQTFDAYKPGDQVFNSYGRKTNSELLLSYGFMIPETAEAHNDYLHVRKKAGVGGPPISGTTADGSPKDFLVSLRPIHYVQSSVAWARQIVAKDPDFDTKPEFAHVEESLVWDLCLMVVGDDNKRSFVARILSTEGWAEEEARLRYGDARGQELECLRRILSASASIPEEATTVVDRVKQLLLAKLGLEYDKLCETDPGVGVDEEGSEIVMEIVPQTHKQEVAMLYRTQMKKVLENAITPLAPDWQSEASPEQD